MLQPAEAEAGRKKEGRKKEGYPERQTRLESKPSWWLLGNVIFGGLIGLIIDLAAGGGFTLRPGSVDIDLGTGVVKELEKPADAAEASLRPR